MSNCDMQADPADGPAGCWPDGRGPPLLKGWRLRQESLASQCGAQRLSVSRSGAVIAEETRRCPGFARTPFSEPMSPREVDQTGCDGAGISVGFDAAGGALRARPPVRTGGAGSSCNRWGQLRSSGSARRSRPVLPPGWGVVHIPQTMAGLPHRHPIGLRGGHRNRKAVGWCR